MAEPIDVIRYRNRIANIACEKDPCETFRCAHVKEDIETLLAEIDKLTARIQRGVET